MLSLPRHFHRVLADAAETIVRVALEARAKGVDLSASAVIVAPSRWVGAPVSVGDFAVLVLDRGAAVGAVRGRSEWAPFADELARLPPAPAGTVHVFASCSCSHALVTWSLERIPAMNARGGRA